VKDTASAPGSLRPKLPEQGDDGARTFFCRVAKFVPEVQQGLQLSPFSRRISNKCRLDLIERNAHVRLYEVFQSDS
jgi:hypothetical protein